MSLKDTLDQVILESQKITNETTSLYADLIAYRALIARLGDTDNNRWWNTLILSKFGKQHLAEFLPRTIQNKRIPLAFALCARVEKKIVSTKKYVSLFNLDFETERKISLLFSENSKPYIERILDLVERTNYVFDSPGWVQQLGYQPPSQLNDNARTSRVASMCLGILDEKPNQEELAKALKLLFAGYGLSYRGNLIVPYYEVITNGS